MIADWENSRFDIEEIKIGLMIRDAKKLGNYIFLSLPEIDKIIFEYNKVLKQIRSGKKTKVTDGISKENQP